MRCSSLSQVYRLARFAFPAVAFAIVFFFIQPHPVLAQRGPVTAASARTSAATMASARRLHGDASR